MSKARWRVLPASVRHQIIRMAAQGLSVEEIRVDLDVAMGTVYNVLRPLGGVIRKDGWSPTGLRLSLDERVEIRVGLETGASLRAIAVSLGRSPSTICREVRAGGGASPGAARESAS